MLGENAVNLYGFDKEKLAPIVARIGPKKSDFISNSASNTESSGHS